MSVRIKNDISTAFKLHGLTLRSEASKYLTEVLASIPEELRKESINRLVDAVQKQPLESMLVNRNVCEAAVLECNAEEDDVDILKIIDINSFSRFTYNYDKKKFLQATNGLPELFTNAEAKITLFRERYSILHQRTLRHELFVPPVLGGYNGGQQTKKFELKPIEFLLGSTVKLGNIIVLGLLTQLKEAKWYIEDPTGAVPVDLTRANFHTGLFTENCFVLAEGWYEDGIFHVNAFGFPPAETAAVTRSHFGNINFFGGNSKNCAKVSLKLQQTEQQNEDAMFVILSDVWLDQPKVLEKLKVLFTGFSDTPPLCFIFFGNFLAQSSGFKQAAKLKECFEDLTDLLIQFPNLLGNSKFLFVPGPQDVGGMGILPRPSLPSCLTENLLRKVPKAKFVTNPCRLQYCTQEIVLFREDIIMKMCRNCVRYPTEGAITSHFAKSVISQSHLCPLPLHVLPIYWAFDHTLRLYPLPDVVICADKHDAYVETQSDCFVVNPGSFPRNDFSFKVYYPATKQFEDSRIDS